MECLSDTSFPPDNDDPGDDDPGGGDGSGIRKMDESSSLRAGSASVVQLSPSQDFVSRKPNKIASGFPGLEHLATEAKLASQGLDQRVQPMVSAVHELEALGLLVELGLDEMGQDAMGQADVRQVADAAAYDVDDYLHRAWLLRQQHCPLGVLWNYYGDSGRGDTQDEWDAYNEFNQYGEFMENPVAPWFENGDDENGGPDAFTHFIG